MRWKVLSLSLRFIIAALVALVFIASIIARPQRSTALQTGDFQKKFQTLVRRGVGTEVSLARAGAPAANIRISVHSAASFIRKRSGLELNTAVTKRLAIMEESALSGATRRITADELIDILAKTLLERIGALTDSEIEQAAETLCGFNAPDLPETARASRKNVRLRANRIGGLTTENLVEQAKVLRDSGAIAALLTSKAREAVGREVRARLETLAGAAAEQWGDAPKKGLTPLQALLIAYSAVSDDYLWYSEKELKGLMKSMEKVLENRYGYYPSSNGRFAYGANGYIFSTPLDLVFSERVIDRLLDRLEERSAK